MNLLGDSQSRSKIFRIPLKLHAAQKHINDHMTRFTILRAGRKFGKTTLARKKTLDWLSPPNSCVWYIGPTYKQTKLVAWEDFKRMIPQDAMKKKPNDTDLTVTLKHAGQLYLMGSDEPDSLRGPAPTAVIIEEAAQHKREVWHEVIRPNLLPHRSPCFFIGTPKGFNWMKDLEDSARLDILQGGTDWSVFHYTVYDNPTLDPHEIEQARRDCDNDAVWRQEYMAEYESSVGRVFASFSDARHLGNVPGPGTMPCGRAIDWGMRDDTACLWGYVQKEDGKVKLKVYREYADNNLPASTQAGIISAMTPHSEKTDCNIIGHDAAKQDVQLRGLTVRWHFSNAGISPLRVGSRDKKNNRAMIQQLVTQDRLLIDKSCVKLRKQMLAYEWKDTLIEKTVDGNDDLCFPRGTMIATPTGDKPIEEFSVGDKVIVPGGIGIVSCCGYTGLKQVQRFGNITATPSHKIFTFNRGFVPLLSLHSIDNLCKLYLCEFLRWTYRLLLNSGVLSTIDRGSIMSAKDVLLIKNSILLDFIVRFGNFILEKRFREAFTFITKTAISLITALRIYSAYRGLNILRSMHNFLSGIVLMRVVKSILEWLESNGLFQENLVRYANFAKNYLSVFREMLNFVPLPIIRNGGTDQALIMFQENVPYVERNSFATNTTRQELVQEVAIQNLPGKPAEVFNLTVDSGCYFANHVLVSNCDALHSLVELYQYDLFQSRQEEKELSLTEKYQMIAQERREKKQRHYFPITSGDKAPGYDFEDNPAGYVA